MSSNRLKAGLAHDDARCMLPARTTMPAITASVAVAAVIAGVVVGAVESGHHKSARKGIASQVQTVSLAQRQAIAHQLASMALPKGVSHSTICPGTATPTDACFTAALDAPATSALVAADDAEKLLTSMGVTLGVARHCAVVTGSPQGSGYLCNSDGVWHGNAVATLVFVSDQAHRLANVPGLDAELSVPATR